MKKVSFCVMALLLVLLPSCISGPEEQASSQAPSSSYTEHMEISVAYWNIREMASRNDRPDAIQQLIEDRFNISLELTDVSWFDYEDRYNVMAATNSLPDVFATNMTNGAGASLASSLKSLVNKKAIRALPEDLSNYPEVQEVLQMVQGNVTQLYGKNYTIPRTSFEDQLLSSSDAGLLVRKDWMETLGISDPQSLEEFQRMLVAFVKEDPDGNGRSDTIGLNVNNRQAMGKWVILGIAPECNVYSWVERNGEFIPCFVTPEFEPVVSVYRELYSSGALDPDFHLKKTDDAVLDFVQGKLGALEYKSSPSALSEIVTQWKMYQQKPFEECVKLLHIFPAPDGKRYSNSSSPAWSESAFSSKVDDEKMGRILSIYEFLLSEEGWRLTRLGIEGQDYTSSSQEMSDGNIQISGFRSLLGNTGDGFSQALREKYPSLELFSSLASWGGNKNDFAYNDVNVQRYGESVMELSNEELSWNRENTIQIERPFWFYSLLQDGNSSFSTARMLDDLTRVIIGDGDPVEEWRKIVQGYYAEGLQTYINEKNLLAEEVRNQS